MFNDAVNSMAADERKSLDTHLENWSQGSCPNARQVASNIRLETALGLESFISLLRNFHEELNLDPADALGGWERACRRHQLKGAAVPEPVPLRLGRAIPIREYAKLFAPSPLSEEQVERAIRKVAMAGSSPSPRETRLLRKAPVGRYLIWATFSEDMPSENPFANLPCRTEAIRTALGLGHCPETETLVLLTWRREDRWAELALHRPTVADAAAYPWYRPVSDASAKWGYTQPLAPNPDSCRACPEVVHEVITGETIVFPVSLTF